MELSEYALETLRKDGEFILYRGQHQRPTDGSPPSILVVTPVLERPALGSLRRMEHEYSLRAELDPAWAVQPLALARHMGRTMLVLTDPGGEPLDRLLGRPMELTQFLRLAVALSAALGQLHGRSLIHKDIKPGNVLVNCATGQVWLTGFGIASRLPRERQSPEPPEFIAGTLAYMAPEQTGRMNRSIDLRSDLYSLGVTYYQMVSGHLPFAASDPMEWVHCHIAREAVPPSERLNNVPVPVSAIIMKLLAKTAEERYQTAAGAESDLRRCLSEWETQCRIDEFPLGECDTPDRLLIPEKLYGRASEIDTLLASFDRVVASGRSELVLVSGYSGIGKSSVVNELHKVLVPPRGLFASGKFDQYKRDIPYATLAQAFQSLIRRLLSKSEAELRDWRDALREALGPNGLLIVDLVPELKLIIGEQPPVPDLPTQDAQGRFQLVFRRFIGVFARPEHPLALFLDDLQWLDAATLDLLEDLLTRPDVQHLMLIGAYRDNEVDSAHPLMRKLEAIRKAGATVQEIVLGPLTHDDLGQLIADSFHCELDRAAPLAQLLREKTAGNPFFAIQFVSALAEEELLTFDYGAARWSWDLNRIHAKGYTDNVVDLMVEKLSRLPVETQIAVQQLACLGNSAEFELLTMVYQDSKEEMHRKLWEAVRTGLVFRSEDSYKFLHDRVQEAAYSLIPQELRAEAHLRIGRLLAAQTPPEKQEEAIFEIVNQLNRGSHLITSVEERQRVAELNLIAGRRAKISTAYASALSYLVAGRKLLTEGSWDDNYEIIFSIECLMAECELLTANMGAAENRLWMLAQRAKSGLDFAGVTRLRLTLYTILNRSDRAVEVCLEYLQRGGTDWSPHPTRDQVQREYDRIWSQLGSRPIEALLDLPLMTDPAARAVLDVLVETVIPAHFTDENLLYLVICRMVNLSLDHGNSDGSCIAYVWLGNIAGPCFDSYEAGYRFGRLGYDLVEKRGLHGMQARTCATFGHNVMPWTRHLRDGRDLIYRATEIANRIGDLTCATYSREDLIANLLATGDPLGDTQREAESALDFAQRARFGLCIAIITGRLCLIRTLRGLTPKFGCFNDTQFDELRFERHLANERLAVAECWYWILKLQAFFFASDYSSAIEASSKAQRLLWTSGCFFERTEYEFYTGLSRAALCDFAALDERQCHLEELNAHRKQLERWAANCPENFEARATLMAAEIARIEGRELDAMRLYERAIRSARENGFVHVEGVANEVAARFYLARGFEKIAYAYLHEARDCYLRWGANGKVRQLEELYPQLRDEKALAGSTSTIGTPIEQLDLATVIKVSQAVSSEIVLGKLIETLMAIAVEHAGADRGLLILLGSDEPQIEAEATTGRGRVEVALRQVAATPSELPQSALHYVIRTKESVILDDAAVGNLFSEDAYIRQQRPRSVLCLPLVKQAQLMGVLYLENTLAPRVFTSKRLAMLELLASQAAISLDHARLYAELRRSERYLAQGQSLSHTGSWGWHVATGGVYWSEEHFRIFDLDPKTAKPSYSLFVERIHPEDRPLFDQVLERAVREKCDFEHDYRILLPDASVKFVRSVGQSFLNPSGELEFIGTIMDVTELKRAQELQIALAREREHFAQQRAAELAKANEAMRGCLDALASVPALDEFLGQVMAGITRQLGAVSSTLRLCHVEQKRLTLEFVFQNGRVMSPDEAKYPEALRSIPLEERPLELSKPPLGERAAILHLLQETVPIHETHRAYLLGLGAKTLIVMPLILARRLIGQLAFRFTDEREFRPEDIEIARALASQASLAIQLIRLAKAARQSAVLEERNQLAGEIHDSLAQFFTGIAMQLEAAQEVITTGLDDGLSYVQRATELAQFGLTEARRSALSLQSALIEESGLIEALQKLVERSNIEGRLRCHFHWDGVPEELLAPSVQQDLLRIAQEAISNAVRHAKPTVVSVSLRWDAPNLVLEVTDNGSGMLNPEWAGTEGFGISNMRARAEKLGARLEVRTAAGSGSSIVVHLPMN
jgi:predicted ATPase/signal transduction histidine kinase